MQDFKKYINPFYKDISQVEDFSDVIYENELQEQEYPHLEKVTRINTGSVKILLPRLEMLQQELEDQIRTIAQETGDDAKDARSIYNKIIKEIQSTVERINIDLIKVDSPYFGKIVFHPYDSQNEKDLSLYIGKFAITDKNTHIPLTIDWRAPIANLYYQNSGPTENVDFKAPVGVRKGDLKQKRQFQISRARIQNIYDAKSGNVAADEFLLSQLKGRLGKKLTDIVATIQSQQNEIIREEINRPVIIQGVAGSGKTTILLHRLAYLFFNYKEKIRPEASLIVAPNRMFLDYISDVLPSLGVSGVSTLTYLFWAKKVLNWGDRYTVAIQKENLEYKEYKGSLEFINFLDKYFDEFEERLLDGIPYSRGDLIQKRYFELKKQFSEISVEERMKLSTDFAFAQKQFKGKKTGSFDDSFDIEDKKRREIISYVNRNLDPYKIYQNIFRGKVLDKGICKYTLEGLKSHNSHRYFRMEDLAPMVYLELKIRGTKDFLQDYIVVDEAQDLSHVELATLAQVARNGNITLAGDLAQSIIPPFYIKDWADVKELIENLGHKEVSYHQLNKCYRTTVEIITFANKIFKDRFPKSYKLPEAVLRHGEEIKKIIYQNEIKNLKEEETEDFINLIKGEFEKGAVTCALICRDKKHANEVYEKIKDSEEEIGRDVVTYSQSDYKNGVLVLPVSHAKGLEFDAVIILDLNQERYPDNEYSTRLLYVAITRALHRLTIITNENIPDSPLLDS
ncbi:MAG: 3'-5' exonuclease [Candidatus Dojkabacteria bacterium]|jgi:DNA helicase-2/ATP-dependent DNA helicase PcrA|nr:3'-5' exonuclease [Candidatus Dojkabacteria bacterium]